MAAAQEALQPVVTDDISRVFVQRGWRIFPCVPPLRADDHLKPKAPLIRHGFHNASSDAHDIRRWWTAYPDALVGYVPASGGHVVIDCLPGVGVTDLPVEWQTTRLVKTPNGLHVYFAAQPGADYDNGPRPDLRSHYPDIIDCIRHAGGYVIIPPSPGYRLINDVPALAAPDSFAVPALGSSTRDILGGNSTPLDDREVIPSGEQEDAIYQRALQLARVTPRWSKSEATAMLWQFIQDRCPNTPGREPWTEADARRKVQAAFRVDITHPIQVDDDRRSDKLQLLTTDAMRAMPPMDYVLPQYIVRGVNFLTGAPGAWKTFLALSWAAQVAGPVVYICREGVGSLARRLDTYCKAHDLVTADQVRWIVDDVQLPDHAGRIIDAIGQLQPAVIVVDTLTDTSAGLDENSSDMRRVYAAMRTVQLHFRCAVLTLVHTGWDGKRERGHSSIRGMADVSMILERNGTAEQPGPVARLRCVKTRDDEPFLPVYLQLREGEADDVFDRPPVYLASAAADDWHAGEASNVRANERCERVLQYVRDHPDCTQYAVRMDVPGGTDTLRQALDELVADGLIAEGVGTRNGRTYHAIG